MIRIDAEALQTLIDTYGGALTLYARLWCRAPDDAVQETWIQLIQQDSPPEKLLPWLYTTVRNRAMNLARGESRRAQHQSHSARLRDRWFLPDETFNDIDYEALIARLPLVDREIVVARIWGELSFAEIAELVELSLSSVHRRYHGALETLQRILNETENTKGDYDASVQSR